MNKPTCFISYSHDDADPDVIEYLVSQIKSHAKQEIVFYLDQDLPFGKSFPDFMTMVDSVDVVIVLLTPSYKNKTLERRGGVYDEFKRIVEKHEATNAARDEQSIRENPAVIPIIISGTRDTSVPSLLADARSLNLTDLVVRKQNGGFSVLPSLKSKYDPIFSRIASQIIVKDSLATEEFQKKLKQYFDDLFVNLKEIQTPQEVLLKTTAYELVRRQASFFVIGRKGSGKSTLARMLRTFNTDQYAGEIRIRADNLNLQLSYQYVGGRGKSDFEQVINPSLYFKLGWQGFLTLCMVDLLIKLDNTGRLASEQKVRIPLIRSAFAKHFNSESTDDELQAALFIFATQKVSEFLDHCVATSRADNDFSSLLGMVVSAFTPTGYIRFLLGDDVHDCFLEILDLCERRVLITLDDFDHVFDAFRRRAVSDHDRQKMAKVEIEWLRQLLILVNTMKDKTIPKELCIRNADFCLTIPHDRFAEIECSDRDAYRYGQSGANILWSGIELCELLVLRLQKMSGYSGKGKNAREKLDDILMEKWPSVPRLIRFYFNGFLVEMPIFLYVLRHTFWRPRDVLRYFGSILAAAQSISEKGEFIDSEVIRQIISLRTRDIIGTEFLREYECAIFSIEHVIRSFVRSPQQMQYDHVAEIIGRIPFGVAAEDEVSVTMDRKIEILYEIGFLGVQLDDRTRNTLVAASECFYFNEGRGPLRAMKQSGYRCGKFVIHPIFAEYLLLDLSNNDFMLNLTWEYTVRTHSTIVASAKGW